MSCYFCNEGPIVLLCAKLHEARNKIEILFHYRVCILYDSAKFPREEECQKKKNLKCDVFHGQHERVLHLNKNPPSGASVVGSKSRHAENSTAMAHTDTILPIAVNKVKVRDGQNGSTIETNTLAVR